MQSNFRIRSERRIGEYPAMNYFAYSARIYAKARGGEVLGYPMSNDHCLSLRG
jgi:hypothetical protein